jgi:transcriptional regulator with XRE-family HTH domain
MSQYTLEQRAEFQELIKGKRQARGWNQTEAGEAAGVGQRNISELERGPSPGTPFHTIAKVAKAYGISLDYIATILGLFDADNSVSDEDGDFERRTGFTSDLFKLPPEEQARAKRLINYYIMDRLYYTGNSTEMMPVKQEIGASKDEE